jgi:hypothetical protein
MRTYDHLALFSSKGLIDSPAMGKTSKIVVLTTAIYLALPCKATELRPGVQVTPDIQHAPSALQEARRDIARGQYDLALRLLDQYVKQAKSKAGKPLFHFYAIDAIGGIRLKIEQDPDGTIQFFKDVQNDSHLSAAEQDIVQGWIARAGEWKKLGKLPKDIHDSKTLFELGKKFYDEGVKRQKFIGDRSGDVDFNIASIYLIPFTVHYDKDPHIGEALFMMGDIRRRGWYDNEYWTENFYLTEVIRRFSGTPLAQRAYAALDEDVHFGYTGSSGDHTPDSWIMLLKELKNVSEALPQALPTPLK